MPNSLTQKTWTNEKRISIDAGTLLVKTKNIREEVEYRIKFDELGFDLVKKRVKSANIPFYILLLFDLMYVGLIVAAVLNKEPIANQLFWVFALLFFGAATVAAFYNRNTDMIYLTGGSQILELMAKRPAENEVNKFIEQIHLAMRKYFKNKYTVFDPGATFELKVAQLKWLKEIQAISEDEYQEILSVSNRDKIIGFQQFSS